MLYQKLAIAQLLKDAGYHTPRLSDRYFRADDLVFAFNDDDRLTKVSVRLGTRGSAQDASRRQRVNEWPQPPARKPRAAAATATQIDAPSGRVARGISPSLAPLSKRTPGRWLKIPCPGHEP